MASIVACKPDAAGSGQPTPTALPAPTKAPSERSAVPAEAPLVTVVALHHGPSPAANEQMLVAVGFNIAPDWHIYWENPGDSGLATEVDFVLPDGFTVTPPSYPAPQRIVSSSGQISYGYEHHAALFFTVSGPFGKASQPLKIDAVAEFLVCRESCQRGKQAIAWHLDPKTPARPLDQPWLALAQRLPRDDAAAAATKGALRPHAITLKGDRVELSVHGRADERIEAFFPLLTEPYRLVTSEVREGNLGLHYRDVEGPAQANWWQSSRRLGVAQVRTTAGGLTFATVRSDATERQ